MPTATTLAARVFLCAALAASTAAQAEPIVGITQSGRVGFLDTPLSFAPTGAQLPNALARDPTGRFLTTSTDAGVTRLAIVDPVAHTVTLGNAIDLGATPAAIVGLAFSPAGVLYALNDGGAAGQDTLWTLAASGAGTLLGATGFSDLTDLAIAGDGTLYAWSVSGGLTTREPAGAFKRVNPALGAPNSIFALTFANDGKTLLGADSALYQIDTATGGLTFVTSTENLRGIAVAAVPEPASVILLMLALAVWRRSAGPAPRVRRAATRHAQ